MSIKENSSSGFVDRLEALRGVASLWVAVFHSMLWLSIGSESAIWAKPIWQIEGLQAHVARVLITFFNGAAAVDIFFVLSGFVLARSLTTVRLSLDSYARFVVKRLFRVAPAFWLSLAIVVCYLVSLFPGHSAIPGATGWFINWYKEPLTLAVILKNAVFVSPTLNPNAWTLKVEILASALLPLIVWSLGQRSVLRNALILFAALSIAWFFRAYPAGVAHYSYMFVVGAIVSQQGQRSRAGIASHPVFVVGCIALVLTANACFPLVHQLSQDILTVAGAGGLIWSIASGANNPLLSILDTRWARFLGRISYSFYLLHFIVLYAVSNFLLHALPTDLLTRWPLPVMAFGCVLSIGIAVPISAVTFDLIEKPFTLLGRRIAQNRGGLIRAER
ncbi:acyltransferase family protein [Paraburkholderia domus]|uniref:acyltransferase family protein n=1 Tax=Paraburkholderia domus TaxID=2793075 RepID=UPI001911834E|nr:acyltransferase [Paraburkholderia domus]MBK5059623.1 acyltransferase [Burkholderia sp. R-70199]CAE6845306.1 hypothetical protein R70199_00068 [Paraburkholderia domus]